MPELGPELEAAPMAAETELPPEEGGDVSVLIVDDNPAKILALETAVAPLGVQIVHANSGRDALKQLLDREFATVILDVNMPGMDGFETAQLIRGRPRSAHTPIIFVSAINLGDTDVLRGYSLGAVDYILAPVIPEILRAKVSVFVELQRKTAEVKRHAQKLEQRTRELQESQNQLRLAERMAALGTLCAGLGHDMGNLLLPIQARIQSLDDEPIGPNVRDVLEGIGTCVGYLRKLSSGLRMLSLDPSDTSASGECTELGAWWEDAEPMLRNILPVGVQMTYTPETGLPLVRLPRHLLTQMVFNLVQNAADALRSGRGGLVRVAITRHDEGLALVVSDNGPGMSAEVRQRCMEPFFTTKPRGISTGLGLALIHSTVGRVGGRVEIESSPGAGATFTCILPIMEKQESEERRVAVVQVREARKRSLISSFLAMRGVNVLEQEDLEAATLWVTDQLESDESRWREFLEAKPGRKVLLVGGNGRSAGGGVHVIPDNASPAVLRKALWS